MTSRGRGMTSPEPTPIARRPRPDKMNRTLWRIYPSRIARDMGRLWDRIKPGRFSFRSSPTLSLSAFAQYLIILMLFNYVELNSSNYLSAAFYATGRGVFIPRVSRGVFRALGPGLPGLSLGKLDKPDKKCGTSLLQRNCLFF